MTKLKLCPFCGSEAGIEECDKRWFIWCNAPECPMEQVTTWGYDTKKRAMEAWNRRCRNDVR